MIKNFLKSKYNLAFIAVLIVGIYIRLKYLFVDSIWHDEAVYIYEASQLLNLNYLGGRITEPIFLLVINLNKLFASPFIAGRLAGLYFGIAGIILIYLLGAEIKDRFVGLCAALLLTFHHISWFISTKAILDVPLTTMFILSAYLLVKLEKSDKSVINFKNLYNTFCSNFWAVLLGFVLIASMLTKKPGILAIVFVLFYFIFTRRLKIFTDAKSVISLGIPIGFLTAGSIIYYLIFKSFVLKSFFVYVFSVRSITEPFNFVKILPGVLTWYVIPFFVLGMVFSLIYRRKHDILLLCWFWVYFLFFSISIGGALPRYLLPALPAVFLLTALSLSEIRLYLKKLAGINLTKWVFVIVVVLLCIPFYQQGLALSVEKANSYTGFEEAGEWLVNNVPEDVLIYAGSPAAIRLFTDFEYINEGYAESFGSPDGKLYYGFPETRTEFEQQLEQRDVPVYLEVDIWEYKNQQWMYPLTEGKISYLYSSGFELVKLVQRNIMTEEGLRNVPVIFILKKAR